MKTTHAGLVVFSGLAALATGEALPAADIPVECATICGPMVELTAMCSPRSRLAKRRRLDEPLRLGGGNAMAASGRTVRDDDRLERREFVTLVPAPASFPNAPAAGAATPSVEPADSPSASQPGVQEATSRVPTRVTPVIVQSPPTMSPPPRPPQAPAVPPPAAPPPAAYISSSSPPPQSAIPPATTTGVALGAHGPPTTSTPTPPGATSSALALAPSRSGSQTGQSTSLAAIPPAMDPEEKCVCLNRSFDVARLAALCASCIMQSDDGQNNMHVIMDTCDFPSLDYMPSMDSEANNINVVASVPTVAAWNQNAGVASEAARTRSFGVAAGAVCLVVGAAIML